MGLLDDAIREHLDLKRRRGADPAEIERAEREALGPVRRAPEDLEADQESLSAGDQPGEYEAQEDWPEEPGELYDEKDEAPSFGHVPSRAEQEHALAEDEESDELATRVHRVEDEAPAQDAGPVEPKPPAEPPPQAEEHARAEDKPRRDEETAEYDVEQDQDQQADEVLEETPDFLQDAPDHDRLWFEQRPPRDFDFDG